MHENKTCTSKKKIELNKSVYFMLWKLGKNCERKLLPSNPKNENIYKWINTRLDMKINW